MKDIKEEEVKKPIANVVAEVAHANEVAHASEVAHANESKAEKPKNK